MGHTQNFNLNDSKKYYSWRIVTYCDLSLFINDIIPLVNHYAFIKHDKEEAAPHYHLIITLKVAKSGKALIKLFPTYQNTFIEPTNKSQLGGDFLYLTHSNDSSKLSYDISKVVCDDFDYFYQFTESDSKTNNNIELFEDITNENFDIVYLVKKYGRDFIINYRKYREFHEVYNYEYKGIMPKSQNTRLLVGESVTQPKLENENIKM
jgi:hypothetical protein